MELSVKRFQDETRYMLIYEVLCPFDETLQEGELYRVFLTEPEYNLMRKAQSAGLLRIARTARIVEGHIIPLNKKRNPRQH